MVEYGRISAFETPYNPPHFLDNCLNVRQPSEILRALYGHLFLLLQNPEIFCIIHIDVARYWEVREVSEAGSFKKFIVVLFAFFSGFSFPGASFLVFMHKRHQKCMFCRAKSHDLDQAEAICHLICKIWLSKAYRLIESPRRLFLVDPVPCTLNWRLCR